MQSGGRDEGIATARVKHPRSWRVAERRAWFLGFLEDNGEASGPEKAPGNKPNVTYFLSKASGASAGMAGELQCPRTRSVGYLSEVKEVLSSEKLHALLLPPFRSETSTSALVPAPAPWRNPVIPQCRGRRRDGGEGVTSLNPTVSPYRAILLNEPSFLPSFLPSMVTPCPPLTAPSLPRADLTCQPSASMTARR